jgi:hypothetical protein
VDRERRDQGIIVPSLLFGRYLVGTNIDDLVA